MPFVSSQVPHSFRTPLTGSPAPPITNTTIYTPPSTASPSPISSPTTPSRPTNKSVNFAPLSPTSSRRLAKIHKQAPHSHAPYDANDPANLPPSQSSNYNDRFGDREVGDDDETDHVYDSNSPETRRRRRRRNSDPSSDRPIQPNKHRRRYHNASRSPSPHSPSSSDVEVLPDRFDKDGRPLDRYGNPFQRSGRGGTRGMGGGGEDDIGQEMVERFTREISDVMEGKKSWVSLLKNVVSGGPSPAGSTEDLGGGKRRRR
jgi:hypothetical protein